MQYIQMEKNDKLVLIRELIAVPNVYPSGNRRSYIAKLSSVYFADAVELKTIIKDLKYFKKLLTEDPSNKNVEHLKAVIRILEKYVKLSEEE